MLPALFRRCAQSPYGFRGVLHASLAPSRRVLPCALLLFASACFPHASVAAPATPANSTEACQAVAKGQLDQAALNEALPAAGVSRQGRIAATLLWRNSTAIPLLLTTVDPSVPNRTNASSDLSTLSKSDYVAAALAQPDGKVDELALRGFLLRANALDPTAAQLDTGDFAQKANTCALALIQEWYTALQPRTFVRKWKVWVTQHSTCQWKQDKMDAQFAALLSQYWLPDPAVPARNSTQVAANMEIIRAAYANDPGDFLQKVEQALF